MSTDSTVGRSPWARVGVGAVIGLITGALTQLGQGLLPDELAQTANAISPWLLVAFLVAATLPTPAWAVVAGIVTLATSLIGYYALVQLRFGYGGSTSAYLLWGAAALAGGVVFGLAGWTWRHDPRHRRRALAIGLLAAVFLAEAIYVGAILGRPEAAIAFGVVGLALPAIIGRSREDRLGGYVAIVPALALGALGYVALTWFAGVTAGVG